MGYFTRSPDGSVLVHLYVQPKASKNRVIGLFDGCLKIAVAAPPVDGKANEEVVKFLARLLNIAARDIIVKSGAQSRRKHVRIQSKDPYEIIEKIEGILLNIS